MSRASLPLLLLLLTGCSALSSAEPYDDTLPEADLAALAGQEVVFELRTERDVPIVSGRLHDDLRRALESNGLRLVEKGPLVLNVKFSDFSTRYRRMTWESCGRLSGQLTRGGQPVARNFITDYCSQVTANLGDRMYVRWATQGERDAYERAYFGLLHAFFNDLEQTVTTTLKG